MAKNTKKVTLNDSPLKEPIELLVTACALTNSNALVVGAPGGGKTALLKWSMVKVLGGEDSLKVLELSESTREEAIAGSPNPLYKLTPNAKEQGVESWIVDETLLDPKFRMALADELTRSSTAANSALIHRMHSESHGRRIPVLATANWLRVEERTAPLFDRFASVIFVEDDDVDVEQFFHNAQPRYWDYNVPDSWEAVMEIRQHLDNFMKLADKSKHPSTPAIQSLVEAIIEGVKASNSLDNGVTLKVSYRRLEDIMKIAYATSVYYSGDPEFTTLHQKTYDTIALCYPATDTDEQRAWRTITSSVGDAEGSAIETYMAEAYGIAKNILKEGGEGEELLSAMASHVNGVRDSLKESFGNTPAVKKAVKDLEKYTSDIYSGKVKL